MTIVPREAGELDFVHEFKPRCFEARLFAVSMRDAPAKTSFEVMGRGEKEEAEVSDSERKIAVEGGKYEDAFSGNEVKLYRIW